MTTFFHGACTKLYVRQARSVDGRSLSLSVLCTIYLQAKVEKHERLRLEAERVANAKERERIVAVVDAGSNLMQVTFYS